MTRIVMAAAVLMTLARAFFVQEAPLDQLATADNDDILRFLAVRDLLAGQSWFDTTQYRILPPEGLSLHWSRYVDAGIAALIVTAAFFVPMASAEAAAIVGWPILLLVALIVITGSFGRRALGPLAAIIAVLMLMIWPVTNYTYFRLARLDHHNVQIVLTTLMVLALIVPGRAGALGVLAGLSAALSMAVGLETVPLVGLTGVVLVVRAVLDPGVGHRALAFSTALFLGALLAFAGQTHPSDWALARCDQLSSPWLLLSLTGCISISALVFLGRRSRTLGTLGLLATATLGLGVAAPMLAPCLAGPYANLPEDVRALIPTIAEARPAPWFVAHNPTLFFENVAPAFGAVVLGTFAWILRWAHGLTSATEDRALTLLLTLGIATAIGLLWQVRVIVLTAAVVPLLTGYGLAAAFEARRTAPSLATACALFVAGTATLFEPILFRTWQTLGPQPAMASTPPAPDCRSAKMIQGLNALPAGRVFNPINLGAPIALLTEHSVSSAPYHRAAAALTNGLKIFAGDEATFRQALRETEADYVVLCAGVVYGEEASFASHLAGGRTAPGLIPVFAPEIGLIVLKTTTD